MYRWSVAAAQAIVFGIAAEWGRRAIYLSGWSPCYTMYCCRAITYIGRLFNSINNEPPPVKVDYFAGDLPELVRIHEYAYPASTYVCLIIITWDWNVRNVEWVFFAPPLSVKLCFPRTNERVIAVVAVKVGIYLFTVEHLAIERGILWGAAAYIAISIAEWSRVDWRRVFGVRNENYETRIIWGDTSLLGEPKIVVGDGYIFGVMLQIRWNFMSRVKRGYKGLGFVWGNHGKTLKSRFFRSHEKLLQRILPGYKKTIGNPGN